MRLARLDLLAFGHFTDVRLNFNQGLQIVYGPNEAGKTTALRAIRQLLFGFDEKTPDNFVHQYSNLRIGATILDRLGNSIEVVRRKTRKDSLRTADESSNIDPDFWQQLLCGIDEATFSKRYGIDYEQLTNGGHEISTGTGDLGEILFATGSGIADLTSIRKLLNDEAGKLFKPTGRNQKLILAITEWQKNRTLAKDKLLLANEWEEVDRRRADKQDRLDRLKRELAERTREADLDRRYQRAIPLLQEQAAVNGELEQLASVKRLPSDFSARKYEALTLLKHVGELQTSAQEILDQFRSVSEPANIANELLDRTDDLTRLFSEWGSYRKAEADRPNLMRQYEQLVAECDALLKKLDIVIETDSPLPAAFDRTKRAKLGPLARKQLGLLAAVERHQNEYGSLQQQLARIERDLTALPVVESQEELRECVRRARNEGDLESQLGKTTREIELLDNESSQKFDQLSLKPGSFEQLETVHVPSLKTIRDWEDQFAENQRQRTTLQARFTELETEIHQTQSAIDELQSRHTIVTPEDLARAREIRDAAWKMIRQSVDAGSVPTHAQLLTFEQSQIEADRIADRLHREASQVAQFAELDAALKGYHSRRLDLSNRLSGVDAERIELEKRWQTEWPDLGSAPLSPRDMQTWISKREEILQLRQRISNHESEKEILLKRIEEFSKAIGQALSLETPAQRLNELLELAERRIESSDASRLAKRDAEETRSRLKRELTQSSNELDQTRNELVQSKAEWQSTLIELSISPTLSPDDVETYLESLHEFTDRHGQAENLRQRLSGIDSDASTFAATVQSMCDELSPDLSNLATNDIVQTLRDRLLASQKAQTSMNEKAARIRQAEQQIATAKESRKKAEELVIRLCIDASIEQPAPESFTDPRQREAVFERLSKAEERSDQKDVLQSKLDRVVKELQALTGDLSSEQFLKQAGQFSSDQLLVRIQQADTECRRLADERDFLLTELGEFNLQLRQMDGRSEAAEIEESQRQLAAQIRSDVEQYARVKLASSILRTSIEKYREKIRGPILSVASELFRELTLDSFRSLRIDEDEQGNPILVGIRNGSGDAISVDGMSEGTCDQLYLALRLASLSLESEPRNTLPFIVDDILVQFDDARSAAALRILSRIGQQRQIIFFTHNEHLVELAQKHLAGGFNSLKLTR